MKRKLYIILGILFTISVSIFVFNSIYQNSIPKIIEEINNSSIGAILTAIITVLLLSHQSSCEEVKEKNVKVFEAKSQKFTILIDKLWEIWEDRIVSLEELNQLIKIISKDIVLYTKPETVDKILENLLEIADQAKPDKTDIRDVESTKKIQKNIFNIINELAKEIDLGGELNEGIRDKLNSLELKVVPYIIQKDFKKKYIEETKKALMGSGENFNFTKIIFMDDTLECFVNNSNVCIRVGSFARPSETGVTIGVYSDNLENLSIKNYRNATRGWTRNFLTGMGSFKSNDIINFSDLDKITQLHYGNKDIENENDLANKILDYCNTWSVEGKSLEQIINETK